MPTTVSIPRKNWGPEELGSDPNSHRPQFTQPWCRFRFPEGCFDLVLGSAMNRFTSILLGAVLGIVCGTLLSIPFNYWYSENFVRSDDDSNFLIGVLLLGIWPLSLLIGGAIGYFLWHRKLTHRSKGRADKRHTL
jgi:hypothetical protein